MATWAALTKDAPDFARRLRAAFDAGTNKTLATLKRDGSPRISGCELEFSDERITLGMMPDSRKLADVLRDPRVALHSPTIEPPKGTLGSGDAKLEGHLISVTPPDGGIPGSYFELQIGGAALTTVEDDQLVVESWRPGRGYSVFRRA